MPVDLDFVVPEVHADDFGRWLEAEGFRLVSTLRGADSYPSHFELRRYHRATRNTGGSIIDVTVAPHVGYGTDDVLGVISSYHSSAVMNTLSDTTLTVYFPSFTTQGLTLPNRKVSTNLLSCLDKYSRRGFHAPSIGNRLVYIQDVLPLALPLSFASSVHVTPLRLDIDW